MTMQPAPRLLLVLLDGLTWSGLLRLVDAGRLPTFATLIERGTSGPIHPPATDPAATWATALTGVHPIRHGIHTRAAIRPDGAGIHPVGARDWRSPPLWQILAQAGISTATVNAPGTSPASFWPGITIDDRFATPPAPGDAEWPMPPGCIHPTRLRDTIRLLRLHPDELDDALRGGLPGPALTEAITVQAAALHVIEHEHPSAVLVVHTLASQAPADDAVAFLDTLLSHLVAAAGPGADIVVAVPDALLVAAGPGFPVDQLRHGLAPADIAATVLARFGLRPPAGPDPVGRPLEGSLHPPLRDAPAPLPVPTLPVPPPPDTQAARRAVTATILTQSRGQALALLETGDHARAATILEGALHQVPNDPDLLLLLGQCRFFLGDWPACAELGHALEAAAPTLPWGPMLRGAALALQDDPAAAPLLDLAASRADGNKPALIRLGAIALQTNDPAQAKRHYAAAQALPPPDPDSTAGLGLAHLAGGDLVQGEALLRQSLVLRFHAPAIHHQLALLYVEQHRWREADDALRTLLRQHPGLQAAEALRRRIRANLHDTVGQSSMDHRAGIPPSGRDDGHLG